MIRVEIVLKDNWGCLLRNSPKERRLKTELARIVQERAELDDLEIVRVQFLPAPPKKKRVRRAAS